MKKIIESGEIALPIKLQNDSPRRATVNSQNRIACSAYITESFFQRSPLFPSPTTSISRCKFFVVERETSTRIYLFSQIFHFVCMCVSVYSVLSPHPYFVFEYEFMFCYSLAVQHNIYQLRRFVCSKYGRMKVDGISLEMDARMKFFAVIITSQALS